MAIANESPVDDLISVELKSILRNCVLSGISDCKKLLAESGFTVRKRTRANIINDRIIFHLKDDLSARSEVRIIDHSDTTEFLVFRDHSQMSGVSIKVKKLDRFLRTANIPTQQVIDFAQQRRTSGAQMLLPFEEGRSVLNVFLGYELAADGGVAGEILLLCPKDRYAHSWVTALRSNQDKVAVFPSASRGDERQDVQLVRVKPDVITTTIKRDVSGNER